MVNFKFQIRIDIFFEVEIQVFLQLEFEILIIFRSQISYAETVSKSQVKLNQRIHFILKRGKYAYSY